jgi:hypothetical protein
MSDAIREVQESTIKPYVSMSMGGQYNVLDKDSKVVYSTRDKTLAYDYFKKNFDKLKEEVEQVTENSLILKAKEIAKKFADSMSKAVAEIEKLEKGLSKNPAVDAELRKYNENLEEDNFDPITEACWVGYKQVGMKDKGGKQVPNCVKEDVSLDEASLKDIFTANQEGKKVEDIAKKLKMSVADVKKILGEEIGEISEENLEEFTSDMIKRLKKSYSTMPQKLSPDQANELSRHLDRLDLTSLKKLSKENIPFLTTLARNKIYKKTGKFEEVKEEDGKIGPAGKITLAKEKDTDGVEKQLAVAQGKINILTQKLENEKNKAIKPVPNKETGEVPLTIGIANKLLKDKEEKESKKKQVKEEKRLYIESIIKKSRIKK